MSRPSAAGARRSQKAEYIETDTGNKISRRSHIEGKQNIMLGGKTAIMSGVTVRGDLARKADQTGAENAKAATAITIGRGTIVSTKAVLKPPSRLSGGQMSYYPMRIGDNVFIGPGTHVEALWISSNIHIGANCVLSPFCILKDGCKIMPDTVIPPSMVVPSGVVVAGNPAQIVGDVGDGWGQGGGGGEGEEWIEGGDLRALVRSIK